LRQPRDVSGKVEVILVATKVDKIVSARRKPTLEKVRKEAGGAVLGFSGVTREGREELWTKIRAAVLGS